ncbi:MAG: U32 family peptidase [Oscillospiraceae bacterium]|nr:U32 family peptidase [Oscillospiraceae bacterium]
MELLSPAGHWEAMTAAVQNGADAVYLGCGSLNARRGAKNFTPEQLPQAVEYCHLRDVKVYLTLNTLLSDREMAEAEALLRRASRCGVDGVIVQDWGLAALARETVPDLPLHGSTQMTVHSLAGVEQAAKLGMKCVVLGRELSGDDIWFICKRSPIAIEVFAHGALCMCWSGQCAMSAMIGQRSGNRGLCAQPCRLPYRFDGGPAEHPLSLKDACLASHLRELRDMGVSILKLEGRMKRPEYVAVITRIYAALLREDRKPSRKELDQLALAFSREGFTEGYWNGKPGPEMFGSRSEKTPDPADLFREAKAAYDQEDMRTVPVSLNAEIPAGRPCRLIASDRDGHISTAHGPVPEAARNRPLDPEDVKVRLAKTGGTVFRAEEIRLTLDPGLSLPASAVNGLRRDTLEQLAALRTCPPVRRESPAPPMPENTAASRDLSFTVSLFHTAQLTAGLLDLAPAVVYLPAERMEDFDAVLMARYPDTEFCAALPRICKDGEEKALLWLLELAKDKGCVSLAVQNIGQLDLAEKLGLATRGGFGLNVFNSRSLEELRNWGLKSACLSFELRYEQVRDLRKPLPCEAIVYGRLPLMLTENCLISNAGKGCPERKGLPTPCGRAHIVTDRRNQDFPVLPVFGCRSEIQNSRTLFLADKPEYRRCGLRYALLRFTTEPPEACADTLAQYFGRASAMPEGCTRGLFYRGVE